MPLPLSLQNAYQDLLAAHLQRAVEDIPGKPFLRQTRGRGYWYATQRIGDRVTQRYLGPDSDEMRERIERAKGAHEAERIFRRRCASMVAQLRAGGLPALDQATGKVLNAMARAGVFRLGGTLVGTHAFRLYAAQFGELFPGLLASTDDIDIAQFAKLAIEDRVEPPMAETLAALSLSPVPTLDPKQRTTRWQMPGGGAVVEFLTPRMTERQTVVKLAPLGLWAQGLPFLNFLIADPVPAVALYREGVLVQVPRPERYAIHKLIVAQRRTGPHRGKARKDLDQAAALTGVLAEQRPFELLEAYETALQSGPAWEKAVRRSLAQRPEIAALISAAAD
jgi:hypothetical protein